MATVNQDTSSPSANEPRAIRLTFAYTGDRIELIQTQRLAMFVPPSESLELQGERSGFWLEVRGADERPLFRQLMQHPIETTREVFPQDPGGAFTRTLIANPRGAFTIVIPDLPEGRTLLLVGSPAETARRSEAAQDVARFDLTTILKRSYNQ